MNHRVVDALMAALAPIVRDYVKAGLDSLSARLDAIEKREPVKGEKGEPGIDGKDGTAGVPGDSGPPGERGADGAPGRDGVDGKDGAAGTPGPPGDKGLDGVNGKDGRDGVPGRDGLPGVQGEKGLDGKHGRDGTDGLGIDNLDVSYDDERTFTFKWSAGERVIEKSFVVPMTIYRGVWKEQTYQRGDEVTWGGSQFIARCETVTKPESDDWQLACKRGRDGRDGKPGEKGLPGAKGERGEPGPRGFGG
jgi:integrin beta 3